MKALFALMSLLFATWGFAQGGGPKSLQDELLDGLVGKWVATGTSHGLSVPQTVQVDWVLNHQFIRIDQKTLENRPGWDIPYEALLFIGYDRAKERYVLHSLTVAGASGPRAIYGERQGNEIKFEANDGDRIVGLRMAWQPDSGTWRCIWGFQTAGGKWETVTELVLARTASTN